MRLNWIPVTSILEVEQLKERSFQTPCLIFKHSERCNISAIARYRLEDDWCFEETELPAYFLDLFRYRSVSNYIADTFRVHHESPQVLMIADGECMFDASHLDITVSEIKEALPGVPAK